MTGKISILLPTRGRPALALRFLDSVLKQSERPERAEVVIYSDEDDPQSHGLHAEGLEVRMIVVPRVSMGAYNMACFERSSGDIVVLANDDIVIKTRGWDRRLREVDQSVPDGIYLAYPNDLFKGSRVCTFPILSRRACSLLGEPFPRSYQGAFIDYHLLDIFKRLEHRGHQRLIYLEDVVFEHMHYRTGKAELDETYRKRGRFEDDPVFFALKGKRSSAARQLKEAIEGGAHGIHPEAAGELVDPAGFGPALVEYWNQIMRDGELPYGWRAFLYLWFVGRYLASKGHLRFLGKAGGAL